MYMINISIPASDCCLLFSQALVMFIFLQHKAVVKGEKNETRVSYWELSTVKRQHCIADMAFTPEFEQRGNRVTSDSKHVLTFGWHQAVTVTV